jgi:ribonucleoside-triphosphate reductase
MLLNKVGQIRKRDGRIVPFEVDKITRAVEKAIQAAGSHDIEKAVKVSQQVVSILEITCRGLRVPDVEEIQDLVEKVLIENGYSDIAKAYILYREQHSQLRRMQELFPAPTRWWINTSMRATGAPRKTQHELLPAGLNNYIPPISSRITAEQDLFSRKKGTHTSGDFHIHTWHSPGVLLRL